MGLFSGLKNLNRRVQLETEAILAIRQYCKFNVEQLSMIAQGELTDKTLDACDKIIDTANACEFTVIYMTLLALQSKGNSQLQNSLNNGCPIYIRERVQHIRVEVIQVAKATFNF